MIHDAAAQDPHGEPRVQQNEIDGLLQGLHRCVVFRVQVSFVVKINVSGAANGFDLDDAQINFTFFDEFVQQILCLKGWAQHRAVEVVATDWIAKHLTDKEALIDLDAVLVFKHAGAFHIDLLFCRQDAR